MPISQDGYVSFRGSQRRDFGEITHPRPLVFVDVDSIGSGALRLPPTFLAEQRATVVLRGPTFLEAPTELPKVMEVSLKEWGHDALRVMALVQPIGGRPELKPLEGPALERGEEADLLERARALELEALLEFGQAIWRPTTFHYRLITGEHAGAYIKIGDALRQPRDAQVLASWLHVYAEPKLGLIFDTGTLTPVAQALQLAAERGGISLGPISMLDEYPKTVLDVGTTIDRVSGDSGRVALIISVSSSGSLLGRVFGALALKRSSVETRVAVMVDKAGHHDDEEVEVWTPIGDEPPLVPRGSPDKIGCELCMQPGRAAVVPINPFTFDAMLPTQLELVVPDVNDPDANRGLWEAAQRNRAISVEREAQAELRRYRSSQVPMGIKLQAGLLLGDPEFVKEVLHKLDNLKEEGMELDADLVLGPRHEVEKLEDYDAFWARIREQVAPGVERVLPFPNDEKFSDQLQAAVRKAKSVLVFQLGTVSGATIQRGLVGVQSARGGDKDFALQALVLHARPATFRELGTIRNSYGRVEGKPQMRFAWTSVLPDRSPLREEGVALRSIVTASLSEGAKAFLESRFELCKGKYTRDEPPAVLWGARADLRLTPNAIYGQNLDSVTTYVAVGSAMSAALGHDHQMTPDFRVFEMAALSRSYYDPLILGCMLRWMRPHEVFWGWTAAEAKTTALHILDRSESLGAEVLVPEMLLAAGQGKLTREAAEVAINVAKRMRTESRTPESLAAILEVGLALVGDPRKLPPTEGLYPEPAG